MRFGVVQRLRKTCEQLVELVFGDDHRRAEGNRIAKGTQYGAMSFQVFRQYRSNAMRRVERAFGRLVGNKFDGANKPTGTYFTDKRMILETLQLTFKQRCQSAHIVDNIAPLIDFDRLDAKGTT